MKKVRIINAVYTISIADISEKYIIDGYNIILSEHNTLAEINNELINEIAMKILCPDCMEMEKYQLFGWITENWDNITMRSDIIRKTVKDFYIRKECELC